MRDLPWKEVGHLLPYSAFGDMRIFPLLDPFSSFPPPLPIAARFG